jgi:tRNA(Ile)-lysidine synthase
MSDPAPLRILQTACGGYRRIGIAVSGGSDSLAALVLAVEALGAKAVRAVTVDHGLRPESAHEAAQVAARCRQMGVAHDTLRWEGPRDGNLQQAARRARLNLIGSWARGRVEAVVLAHTRDDQAETFLMRLARGSGVDGLSGMAPLRVADGVTWLRPFLTVTREQLREALRARAISWVEDPSNADPAFLRVRARQAMSQLAPLGIDAATLADTAARLRRARGALDTQMLGAVSRLVCEEAGTVLIDKAALDLPGEIRDRLFAALLMALSGDVYRPRLVALHRWLAQGGALRGCMLGDAGGQLRLWREARVVAVLQAPPDALWDRRWRASPPESAATGAVIRALGADGLAQLSRQARAGAHPHWRETGLPQAVLSAQPAIWLGPELIAAPLALWPQKWRLSARPVAALVNELQQSH